MSVSTAGKRRDNPAQLKPLWSRNGNFHLLRSSLVLIAVLTDVLFAPVRLPQNVRFVPACRTVLLSADRIDAGSFFSCAESVCRFASHASCVQRYGRRSALSTFLHRPVPDDVADQAALRRARKKNGV